MHLPNILQNLIAAQNSADSEAFTACFTDQALVSDERQTHAGKAAIKTWNETTTAAYQTQLEAMNYAQTGQTALLTVKVSGTFKGSPIVLKYDLVFEGEATHQKIASLKISS